ncbi:MAG: hypothetical protein ACQESC_03125 [Nanobdellota archaeon]
MKRTRELQRIFKYCGLFSAGFLITQQLVAQKPMSSSTTNQNKFKIGASISTQKFPGINVTYSPIITGKLNVSLETKINVIPVTTENTIYQGEQIPIYYNGKAFKQKTTALNEQSTNYGSIGIGISYTQLYVGVGVSHQTWTDRNQKSYETIYDMASEQILRKAINKEETTLEKITETPAYFRLGYRDINRTKPIEIYVEYMGTLSKENSKAQQISVGIQQYF